MGLEDHTRVTKKCVTSDNARGGHYVIVYLAKKQQLPLCQKLVAWASVTLVHWLFKIAQI